MKNNKKFLLPFIILVFAINIGCTSDNKDSSHNIDSKAFENTLTSVLESAVSSESIKTTELTKKTTEKTTVPTTIASTTTVPVKTTTQPQTTAKTTTSQPKSSVITVISTKKSAITTKATSATKKVTTASSQLDNENQSDFEAEVFDLVNKERAKNNLPAFKLDNNLITAADIRAKEIVTLFSHTRPNGDSPFTAIPDDWGGFMTVAENIAAGYPSPEDVVEGWMNSQGHRKNILNPDLTHIGIGYYYSNGSQYGHYWTQLFGG